MMCAWVADHRKSCTSTVGEVRAYLGLRLGTKQLRLNSLRRPLKDLSQLSNLGGAPCVSF